MGQGVLRQLRCVITISELFLRIAQKGIYETLDWWNNSFNNITSKTGPTSRAHFYLYNSGYYHKSKPHS